MPPGRRPYGRRHCAPGPGRLCVQGSAPDFRVSPMTKMPHPDVVPQLEAIPLDSTRPLVVCDADDVLFHFLAGFAAFLVERGLYFDWTSYSLDGTIHFAEDQRPLALEKAGALLNEFFDHVEDLEPIEGASRALGVIAEWAQIVIMTNIPARVSEGRRRSLDRHGLSYPMVTNIGGKGPAVKYLASRAGRPTVFIDDMPRQHASVAKTSREVVLLHFVAEPRVEALLGEAPQCHHKATSWPEAQRIVAGVLNENAG